MRKNVKKIISAILVVMMVLQISPLSVFTVNAAEIQGAIWPSKDTSPNPDIMYEFHEEIATYRADMSYPVKEGYVFAGWWTEDSVSSSTGVGTLEALKATDLSGSAWAKYVAEDMLTVKAQVSMRVTDALDKEGAVEDGKLTANKGAGIKLRLVTSTDDRTKYEEIGFKVKINSEMQIAATKFFTEVSVNEVEGAKKVTPETVFGVEESNEFAALVIGGFKTVASVNETELKVTPYWKTLDGTTVYGTSRERLLMSDERANDKDGNNFSYTNNECTYSETAQSTKAAYQYLQGGSDTVYLKGSYTTTGSANNHFGISIRNGGQTRQIYFDGVGVKILSNEGLDDATVYNTVRHTDLIYVWSQSTTSSVVGKMLSTAGTYDVIWAIEKNVLYCSVTAEGVTHVVFSIPMTKICTDWNSGRYYQLGVATYNSGSQNQPLEFKVNTLAFGKAAKKLLVTESNNMPLDAFMCYEPITGSYMAASKTGASYRYGVPTTGAQAMKTTIHLADADATTSSTGVTVRKTDGQSAQILLTGSSKTAKMQFDHQTVATPIDITSIIPDAVSTYDVNGGCEVTVIVKQGKLYIQYNGVQAGSLALNKIIEGYKTGDELQLGLFAWDTANGLSRFSDVEFITGDAVNNIATTDANWNNLFLRDESIYVNMNADCAQGIVKNTASSTVSRLRFNYSNTTWEISGKINRNDQSNNKALLNIGLKFEAEGKELRIDSCYQGINLQDGTIEYRHGDNALAFNPSIYSFFGNLNATTAVDTFAHTTNEIYFKFLVVDDRLYALFGADEDNLVPSWNIPLDEKIVHYDYNTSTTKGTYNESSTIFDGFTSGSSYKVNLYTTQTAGVESTISNLVVNMGDMVDVTSIAQFPKFHTETEINADINATAGTIATNKQVMLTRFQDYSATWEITGTMTRTDAMNAEAWCPGFEIMVGEKNIRLDAVTEGIVFLQTDYCPRYAYHAIRGVTTYNLNPDISKFIKSPRTESVMNFRAVIANDKFYAWFGFEGEEMKLSWVVPLAEALYGVDEDHDGNGISNAQEKFFDGFTSGSKYMLGLYVPGTTGLGNYSNLVVKTGDAVDTSFLAKFQIEEEKNAVVNLKAGTIASIPSVGPLEARFKGVSTAWEVTGTMTRTDATSTDPWCPGFNIKVGDKELTLNAVSQGIILNQYATNRYPYHAFGKTDYNLNTDISQFLTAAKKEMNFKAVIVDDTFYAWFGYEGEQMKLSWVVPLDENLYGVAGRDHDGDGIDDAIDVWFEAFASGSSYNLGLNVMTTGCAGQFSDVAVKTGTDVDTSFLADVTN